VEKIVWYDLPKTDPSSRKSPLERVFWKNIKEAESSGKTFEESIEEDGSTRKANLEADLSDKIEKENEEG